MTRKKEATESNLTCTMMDPVAAVYRGIEPCEGLRAKETLKMHLSGVLGGPVLAAIHKPPDPP